ncbi:CaiB/BaiF CoA-transferase family protein [Microbacterium pseudoresistens]|uniref:Crotonobetainyl-CoA:carnitine CoA-transferase CaiB-like acyl-CoA transferase n=1 Tax=Microbacterium pseudoresistens TaxID=640634 RepID=A0A7Y9JMS9_9MICO|nr:CoA transferase [Microbacterium pseudoresistens]NYD53843.1 crotonobetainyl-CoA:carnitine CoA-transferase CaiB-like acyl-CoA transferase [Microbacterium pseudoresistens]
MTNASVAPGSTSRKTHDAEPGALDGVVVIDITRVVAGPYCSMILADLGATVIKVEHPDEPDYTRTFPPMLQGDGARSMSGFFAQYNRNKLGVTINLRHDDGKALLRRLVESAHVLVENFRPGTMDKLGVGYETLRQINPQLVYAALSGFGQHGPYRTKPAYDNSAQATGGLWSMNGPLGGPPVRVGTIIGDLAASLYGVVGVLAALRHAERTGEGQLVDISQQDSVLTLTENAVVNYSATGEVAMPLGNQHPFVRPYELFPCADGFVFFGGYTDKFWKLSCEIFGAPSDFADNPDLHSMAVRFSDEAYRDRVRPLIEGWFRSRTKAELENLAGDHVPLSAVKNISEVVADPQIAARDMVIETEYEGFGSLQTFGSPIKLTRTPPRVRGLAPHTGAHTETVLRDLLGLTQDEIADLRRGGTI